MLAIVIPAYKQIYFEKTLNSFASQTNKNFNIYVGDDCSPFDIESICEGFKKIINIKYTRFLNNIGAKNLVKQWTRCVELINGEEWIWLFSDDDLIDNNCVENFYNQKELDNGTCDIYRFNTSVIDGDDNITWVTHRGPFYESSEEMAYNLLLGKRGNSLADHIFSRDVYNRCKGLVFTEYAQGADWAMSILFSKQNGITVIPGSNFYWRYSGSNISSRAGGIKLQMLRGHLQFIEWIISHFQYLKQEHQPITYTMIQYAAKENLKAVLIHHFKGFNVKSVYSLISLMRSTLGMPTKQIVKDLFEIIKVTHPAVHFLSKIKRIAMGKPRLM